MSANAFTIKTLAEHWVCSPDVIYDIIREGKLKAFHVGTALRISAEEVERYEKQN